MDAPTDPRERELALLTEALQVERRRLDLVLERLTPIVTMPDHVPAVLESFEGTERPDPEMLDRDAVRAVARRLRQPAASANLVELAFELEQLAGPA